MWSHSPTPFSLILPVSIMHTHTNKHSQQIPHTLTRAYMSFLFFSVLSCCHLPCFQGWMKLSYCWLAGWLAAHKQGLPGCRIHRQWGWGVCACVVGVLDQRLEAWPSISGLVIVRNNPLRYLIGCYDAVRDSDSATTEMYSYK